MINLIKNNKKKSAIISVILIIIIFYSFSLPSDKKNLETVKVINKNIANTIKERGIVQSKNIYRNYSKGIKKIKKINFTVGDRVKNKDVILEFDTDIQLQIDKINKDIEALQSKYEDMSKGVDWQSLNNIKLEISSMRNSLKISENELNSSTSLYNAGAITKNAYNRVKSKHIEIKNNLSMLNNKYSKAAQGMSSSIKKQYEAQIDSIIINKEILLNKQKDDIIISNSDFLITELNGYVNTITPAGELVLEMQDPENKAIYADLLIEDVSKIKITDKVSIEQKDIDYRIDNLKIHKIYPKASSTTSDLGINQKRVRVIIDLPKNEKSLIFGTEVDISFILKEKENALVVDKRAIYTINEEKFVTVLKGSKEKEIPVKTGIESSKYIEILNGLNLGDIIVIQQ